MKRQSTKKKAEPVRAEERRAARTPRDELNNRLFFRLFQAANIYQTRAVSELGVTAVQGAVLGALSRDPEAGMSFSELYTYLAVSRQNLDAVLKRLEQAGLAERVEGAADRRMKIVRLTPAGVAAWRDLSTRTIEFFRQGTDGVATAEASACVDTLVRIGRALKATRLT